MLVGMRVTSLVVVAVLVMMPVVVCVCIPVTVFVGVFAVMAVFVTVTVSAFVVMGVFVGVFVVRRSVAFIAKAGRTSAVAGVRNALAGLEIRYGRPVALRTPAGRAH
jgi:hypothetical protein